MIERKEQNRIIGIFEFIHYRRNERTFDSINSLFSCVFISRFLKFILVFAWKRSEADRFRSAREKNNIYIFFWKQNLFCVFFIFIFLYNFFKKYIFNEKKIYIKQVNLKKSFWIWIVNSKKFFLQEKKFLNVLKQKFLKTVNQGYCVCATVRVCLYLMFKYLIFENLWVICKAYQLSEEWQVFGRNWSFVYW